MTVCGVQLAGSDARLVLLEGNKASFTVVEVKPSKLTVVDDESADEIRAFQAALFAYLRENHVGRIAVKKRGKSGEMAGGAVSFKLETLIQLYPEAEVKLVPPQTIAASLRRHQPMVPEALYKYQSEAFGAAFTVLD